MPLQVASVYLNERVFILGKRGWVPWDQEVQRCPLFTPANSGVTFQEQKTDDGVKVLRGGGGVGGEWTLKVYLNPLLYAARQGESAALARDSWKRLKCCAAENCSDCLLHEICSVPQSCPIRLRWQAQTELAGRALLLSSPSLTPLTPHPPPHTLPPHPKTTSKIIPPRSSTFCSSMTPC